MRAQSNRGSMNNKELHYKYGISYLVAIIVALIAFALFDVKDLVDKISFALTIASLVLAVVAIIYTFIAASKQENQLSKLIETNHSISIASHQINSAASALVNHVSMLPSKIQHLTDKIETLSDRDVKTITTNLSNDSPDSDEAIKFKKFIVSLPFSAMGILYLFYKAERTGNLISADSTNSWSSMSFDFVSGVLCGIHGTEYIELKYHKDELIPTKCSAMVVSHLEDELKNILAILGEEKGGYLKKLIDSADELFT